VRSAAVILAPGEAFAKAAKDKLAVAPGVAHASV